MPSFAADLQARLAVIRDQDLMRELRRLDSPQGPFVEIDGRTLLNFSSNDYLGLATHPALKEAAIEAVHRFGAGAGASRLICGSLGPLHELEEHLAAFKGTEAALSFSSGYATALGTLPALCGRDDVIIVDKLVHACVVDGARLSGATLRVFAHNDLDDLEAKLRWARDRIGSSKAEGRILIVTESVFSMDGDRAPLLELTELKERYGAWLMLDEAHATGLHGANRSGLAEALGVGNRIEIQMGTLGKALGAGGGYVCGSRTLVDYLVNRARSFIFSTAPVPAAAAAATAAIQLLQSPEGARLCATLWNRVHQLHAALDPSHPALASAITPVPVGGEAAAVSAAATLREQGLLVPAIRYPTVARGAARLRVTCSAAHSSGDVERLAQALDAIARQP